MSSSAKPNRDSDISEIAAIRSAWISAVTIGDIDGLAALGTDDIVFVYGNGRCVSGKDALQVNLVHDLGFFDFEPRDKYEEISFHGNWAVEFIEVDTTVTAVRGGTQIKAPSKVVALYSRQGNGSWKVARVIHLEG
jgi:ketosteroid isomerase-like protein